MALYCQEVRKLEGKFDGLEIKHIPRKLNEAADSLAKMASTRDSIPHGIFASDQHKPSIRPHDPAETGNEPVDASSGAGSTPPQQANKVMEIDPPPAG